MIFELLFMREALLSRGGGGGAGRGGGGSELFIAAGLRFLHLCDLLAHLGRASSLIPWKTLPVQMQLDNFCVLDWFPNLPLDLLIAGNML